MLIAKPKRILVVTIVAMVLIDIGAVIGVWQEVTAQRPDFFDLYGGGASLLLNFLPSAQSQRVDTLHPSFELLIFAVLAKLSPIIAYRVWLVCNLVMLWSVPLILWNHLPHLHQDFHYISIFFGSFVFVFIALIQGQDSILLLFLLTVAFVSLKGSHWAGGIALGLGMFKFFLIIPVIMALALLKYSRIVTAWAATTLFMIGVSLICVGPQSFLAYYLRLFSFAGSPNTELASKAFVMPNIRGLLLSIFPFSGISAIVIPALISGAVMVWAVAWTYKSKNVSISRRYAVLIAACSAASFHFFLHNAVILLLPMLVGANELANDQADKRLKLLFGGGCCAMYVLPNIFAVKIGAPIIAVSTLAITAALAMGTRKVSAVTVVGD